MAAVPIIVIVCITAVKDAIEDYRRTILDLDLNNTATEILAYNHNYNVTDESVSAWRKFKKANTRLMLRIIRAVNRQREKKKLKKMGKPYDSSASGDQIGHELTRATTIYSMRNSYSMSDMGDSTTKDLGNGMRNSYDDSRNPFADSTAHVKDTPVAPIVDNTHPSAGKARFRKDFWKNVRVGDFVRIRNNDEIPADIVVLSTSDGDGACYIETKNLDGESNLKVRQALKCGEGIKHSDDCEKSKFWIESEGPLPNLYAYNGVAKWLDNSENGMGEGIGGSYDYQHDPEQATRSEPISINNVLLRGCSLRNTEWVIGVVIFTGVETKIMLNAGQTPTKRSRISRELNISVMFNFILLFILCFVSGVLNGIEFGKSNTSIDFFEYGSIGGSPPVDGLVTFWAAVILYQSLVPISLYISIEIVKTIQAFFIYSDYHMYYEPIDYPCTPKSWNISDDLGQIEYIFSDKTGTLTQNIMEFKKCTINGMAYGKAYTEAMAGMRKREGIDVVEEAQRMKIEIAADKKEMIRSLQQISDNNQLIDDEVTFISSRFVKDLASGEDREQQRANGHFMLALALCHSVLTEKSKKYPGRLDFKAQSPDEAALVATARDVGFSFLERTQKGVILNVQGVEQEYQILNTLEFNSTRKRMSAIVKFKSGQDGCEKEKILLICKGADSVIYSRLKPGEQEVLRKETALHLEQFANEGLRTLCIAERELTSEEYHDFNRRHELAAAAIVNREEKIEEVADAFERNLTLIGGTAIEDRLQDGVPESIALLSDAGIKLWVLTGDKVETAINIGFSCNLLDNSMELLVIRVDDNSISSATRVISDYLYNYFGMRGDLDDLAEAMENHDPPSPKFAVIIDGDSLKLALSDELKTKFLLLCKQCKSVLCCRVSPAQKAAVVRLVKNTLGVMTLSVGDGANDVAMIQEADVGVGIAGEEGRQAVMSSDYAIGQFRFLTRLLLVHGRWSYKRLAEMIPNFFYKNVVFTFALFWYGIESSFDGAYLFEYTYVMFFNLAFTSLPVIFMGVLDQDVSDVISLHVPQLYRRGILRLEWTQGKFWRYMVDGFYQSFISYFFPYFIYWTGMFESSNGRPLNHRFWMGLAVCSIAVLSCNLYILTNQFRWDWLSLLINVISSLLVYFWSGVYSSSTFSGEFYSAAAEMLGSLIYWAVLLVGVIAALVPHFSLKAYQQIFHPRDIDLIRERWYLGDYDGLEEEAENANSFPTNKGPDIAPYKGSFMGSSMSDGSGATATSATPNSLNKRLSNSMPWKRKSQSPQATDYSFGSDQPREMTSPEYIRFGNDQIKSEEYDFDAIHNDNSQVPYRANSSARRQSYRRQSGIDSQTRQSLDVLRHSLRMEQPMPRSSMDNGIRTSMDTSDLTTAEGLMHVMSRD
ncbi:aminophospholipid-translocating P4-type ATPase DNF1 [Sugiyamaella lignohabitans]|uniref:Phospholipid-transporting ATPase n=1 Tax=Sugiyamaella lignohabitans TaxID=796027 RepID=A0A161HKW8_9ASCO|nr:aminophospholipid-translocating P4-type ATPase DNF1 [Sugiyamaella lignohabitans]ANB12538.1 aminophospholipid-translocating P4-type ATPase DNF1 [Sugiyamaella lignohabitans]